MEISKRISNQEVNLLKSGSLPLVPSSLSSISEHIINKDLSFNFSKMELYKSKLQESPIPNKAFGRRIINSELANRKMYNASFLDFIVLRPEILPKEFYLKCIFFPGTIYLDYNESECIRCLYFDEEGVISQNHFLLDFPFSQDYYFLIEK